MIVWVGSIPVNVNVVDPADIPDTEFGYFDSEAQEIFLADNMPEHWRVFVFLHEWVHAVLVLTGIGRKIGMGPSDEELFCDIFAHQLKLLIETLGGQSVVEALEMGAGGGDGAGEGGVAPMDPGDEAAGAASASGALGSVEFVVPTATGPRTIRPQPFGPPKVD